MVKIRNGVVIIGLLAVSSLPAQAMLGLPPARTNIALVEGTGARSMNYAHSASGPLSVQLRRYFTAHTDEIGNIVQGTWQTGAITSEANITAGYTKLRNPKLISGRVRSKGYVVGTRSFLQLDTAQLELHRPNSVRMLLSSNKLFGGYDVWASNRLGVPGSLIMSGQVSAKTAKDGVLIPDCGQFRYYSISGCNGNIRLVGLTASSGQTATANVLHPMSAVAFGAVMALSSLTLLRRRSSLRGGL